MSEAKFEALLARQLPDEAKRARADFIVDTGASLEHVQHQVDRVLESLRDRQGLVMDKLRRP
jgi:dephospho-CoA kinase